MKLRRKSGSSGPMPALPPGASEFPGRLVRLMLPSRLEMLPVLDCVVQGIAGQMDFDEDATIEIATSVVEAGTNAIQHGNRQNERVPVDFYFFLGEGALEVWVSDQGPGFNVEEVLRSDPTRPEDLLKARGRGIFIMRAMMDSVEFDIRPGEGTLVHLTKQLRRGNGTRTADAC
jgi:anti-sigma regulatory factor (Ser/Thr protein kinase)